VKSIGIFEAKTKLSELCDEVARTHVPIMITRRGEALVSIEPLTQQKLTIKERRAAYLTAHGDEEIGDAKDFEPAERSREHSTYRLKG
jgi:prevent-host-death family protein